jgi:hypothetical protein
MTTTATTAYQAEPAVPPSRRAEQREDARLRAELELAREAARAEQRRLDDRAWAEERRQARADRDARRAAARAGRAAQNESRRAWLREHTVDLLFVPVIGVPGALAWDAMAAYGAATWGPLGIALPLFSEGAMWAFDAAVAIRRRRNPDKPVWHLQLGIVIFAAYGAALNFLHGMAPSTSHHGLVVAVSMALVSVAGVTAHQLVISGPRRSRAERELDRFRREAERRQAAARKAAARMALVEVDEEGHADLVYEPGTYQLTRNLIGAHRLAAPKGRPALAPRPAPAPPALPAAFAGQPAAAADGPASTEPGVRNAPAGHAGFPPPQFYGPDADRDDSVAEDGDGENTAELAGWPQDAVAERLAVQIRAAAAAGTVWKPDYEQLIALTDKSKRWCEAAVSKARRLAEDPGQDDSGQSSQSSPGGPGIVPGAARMPAGAAAGPS